MHKNSITSLFIVVIIFALNAHGQTSILPTIKSSGNSIGEFIPKNWKILKKQDGDLNKDKRDDIAVVLQETRPDKIEFIKSEESVYDTLDTNDRILIVLLKDSTTNKYILKGRTNTFILNRNSQKMSDPFLGIKIVKGNLVVDFFLWYSEGSWYQTDLTYIFRFQKGNMTLIGAEYNEVDRGSSDGVRRSFNFLTKKMSEVKSKLDDKGETKNEGTVWKQLPIKELKTIETLIQPLEWEPIPGVQI